MREVSHFRIRQDDPESTFDEFGEFFPQEIGVYEGGRVTPSFESGVLDFERPRLSGGEYRYPFLPPLVE